MISLKKYEPFGVIDLLTIDAFKYVRDRIDGVAKLHAGGQQTFLPLYIKD